MICRWAIFARFEHIDEREEDEEENDQEFHNFPGTLLASECVQITYD